ncbi:MAG: threonine synthase, partial [Clostridiales bacterium]
SSNFERFFFEMTGRNGAVCQAAFADLLTKGYFEDDSAYQAWKDIIWADYLSDEEAAAVIKENYNDYGYLLDPHTAIAVGVWDKYQKQHKEDTCSVLIDSTANPYKFPAAVLAALGEEIDSLTEPELTGKLSRLTGMPVHSGLLAVENKPICHNRRIKKEAMAEEVLKILGL